MLSNNKIKFVRSLHQNKFRKIHGLFLAEGPKLVEELINSKFITHSIYATQNWIVNNHSVLPESVETETITEKELKRISTLKTPNQVISVVEIPKEEDVDLKKLTDLTLVLDNIQDPGNMGTIIRTADWFGIKKVICSEETVEVYNPKVVQSTMGSIARVNVYYTKLTDYFRSIPENTPVYGAVLDGSNLYEQDLENKAILIIGSESHGISDRLYPYISNKISVPNFSKQASDSAESLNASIATAILCAEFRRQYK